MYFLARTTRASIFQFQKRQEKETRDRRKELAIEGGHGSKYVSTTCVCRLYTVCIVGPCPSCIIKKEELGGGRKKSQERRAGERVFSLRTSEIQCKK